jgi:hypothetical protein
VSDLDLGVTGPIVVLLLAERRTGRRQKGGRRNAAQETTSIGPQRFLHELLSCTTSVARKSRAEKAEVEGRWKAPAAFLFSPH